MMRITLSANAGIALEMGGKHIWVDALHNTSVPGFSTLSEEQVELLWEAEPFQAPDMIVFTHCHPDHYSRRLAVEAAGRWPNAEVVLPQPELPQQKLLWGDELVAALGELRLHFFALPHEKEEYADVPHYGLTVSDGQRTVLIAGDCAVNSPALAARLQSVQVDVALLDFPWVTLSQGRAFIEEYIHPKHLVVYHLPFPGDSDGLYNNAVRRCLPRVKGCGDVQVLERFLQSVSF